MRLLVLLLLVGSVARPQQWPPQRDIPAGPADTLYYNGKIITMWDERPVVESMTVSSGRILDVGTTQIVGRKTGPRTRQVNLQGKTVLPGLIDSHVHPIRAALAEADGEIPVLQSFEAVRRYIEAQPSGQGLIYVPKVYSTRLRERRYPDRWEIDGYAKDRAVMLDNGYAAVLNSAALKMAGISAETPDPSNGKLLRNSAGEPTGLIIGARQLVAPLLQTRVQSHGEMVAALAAMQRAYSEAGLTSVTDRSQSAAGFRAYQHLWQQGQVAGADIGHTPGQRRTTDQRSAGGDRRYGGGHRSWRRNVPRGFIESRSRWRHLARHGLHAGALRPEHTGLWVRRCRLSRRIAHPS